MIYKDKTDLTLWCMLSQPPRLIVLTDHYVHIQRNGIYTEISIQLDQDCQLATSIEVNFFMSAVKLWQLCAGHFRVRRVPRSPVFHTCVQLPPIMWK